MLGFHLINISLVAVVQSWEMSFNGLENAIYSYLSFCGCALHIPLGLPMTRCSISEQGPNLALLVEAVAGTQFFTYNSV